MTVILNNNMTADAPCVELSVIGEDGEVTLQVCDGDTGKVILELSTDALTTIQELREELRDAMKGAFYA